MNKCEKKFMLNVLRDNLISRAYHAARYADTQWPHFLTLSNEASTRVETLLSIATVNKIAIEEISALLKEADAIGKSMAKNQKEMEGNK